MSLRCGNTATCPAVLGTRRGLSMWTTMVPLCYLIVPFFISCIGFGFSPPIPTRMTWCQFAGHVSIFLPSTYIYPNPTKMIYGVNSQASSYDIPIFLHKDYIMYIHSPPLYPYSMIPCQVNSQDTSCPKSRVRVLIWVTLLMGKWRKKATYKKYEIFWCRWQLSFWSLLSFL